MFPNNQVFSCIWPILWVSEKKKIERWVHQLIRASLSLWRTGSTEVGKISQAIRWRSSDMQTISRCILEVAWKCVTSVPLFKYLPGADPSPYCFLSKLQFYLSVLSCAFWPNCSLSLDLIMLCKVQFNVYCATWLLKSVLTFIRSTLHSYSHMQLWMKGIYHI